MTAKPTIHELIAALAEPGPLHLKPAIQRLIASRTPEPPKLTLVPPPAPLVRPDRDAIDAMSVSERAEHARQVHREALAAFCSTSAPKLTVVSGGDAA